VYAQEGLVFLYLGGYGPKCHDDGSCWYLFGNIGAALLLTKILLPFGSALDFGDLIGHFLP